MKTFTITPNKSDTNNYFYVKVSVAKYLSATIFDIASKVIHVYDTELDGNEYKINIWDGKGVSAGVYMYLIEIISKEGTKHK